VSLIVQPINCALKSSGDCSTDAMTAAMKAAFDIKPRVTSDEGDGDAERDLMGVGVTVETHVSPGVGHTVGPGGLAAGAAFARRILSRA
jgi:hypothetical protein